MLKTRLTHTQKIDLLLDSLEGDAKNTAGKSERRDEDDLNRIWGKLVLNYDNPYQQVYAHGFAIISLPTIESPSSESFRHMINLVEEQLRLLSKYDVSSSGWSTLLCIILLQKLDEHSRYLWNTGEKPHLPNIESLFKFLHQRSRALEDEAQCKASVSISNNRPPMTAANHRFEPRHFNNNRSNNISNYTRREEAKPYHRPSLGNQSERTCGFCGHSGHNVPFCHKFLNTHLNQKRDYIRDNNVCRNCLLGKHTLETCRRITTCKTCNGTNHHFLLCDKVDTPRQAN